MRGKIIDASSEHGKEFIGTTGELIFDYEGDGRIHIKKDSDGRYISMTRVKKLTIETQNTIYEVDIER